VLHASIAARVRERIDHPGEQQRGLIDDLLTAEPTQLVLLASGFGFERQRQLHAAAASIDQPHLRRHCVSQRRRAHVVIERTLELVFGPWADVGARPRDAWLARTTEHQQRDQQRQRHAHAVCLDSRSSGHEEEPRSRNRAARRSLRSA
jgi:hypothetical protein